MYNIVAKNLIKFNNRLKSSNIYRDWFRQISIHSAHFLSGGVGGVGGCFGAGGGPPGGRGGIPPTCPRGGGRAESFVPQSTHTVAVGSLTLPHFGHLFSLFAAETGLKHILYPFW